MGLNREILRLAIPSILANITVPLVGLVDMAVAGHLEVSGAMSAASLIGAVAVGSMLFDFLYWNFGFLRIGTGGLTAQACGRKDMKGAASIFGRSISIALVSSVVLIVLQWLFIQAAFSVITCTPQVRELASDYFFVRIWAAPATLSLMVFKGWFIGMQDSVSPLVTDLVVNAMNAAASIILAMGLHVGNVHFDGIGFDGIAWGTVIAQYSGLLCASLLLFFRYWRKVFAGTCVREMFSPEVSAASGRLFNINLDLFVRSLCFICIYIAFTTFSARYGDVILATSSVLMKLIMLFSYFTDGFAYAGEAMTGKYIGAGMRGTVRATVKNVFLWSMSIAGLSMVAYSAGTMWMLRQMTTDPEVVEMAVNYVPWLVVMPVFGCAAFTWDGIYIGATAARQMRNSMLLATILFFVSYYLHGLVAGGGEDFVATGMASLHGLFLAYLVHLAARASYLTLGYRKYVLR